MCLYNFIFVAAYFSSLYSSPDLNFLSSFATALAQGRRSTDGGEPLENLVTEGGRETALKEDMLRSLSLSLSPSHQSLMLLPKGGGAPMEPRHSKILSRKVVKKLHSKRRYCTVSGWIWHSLHIGPCGHPWITSLSTMRILS